LQLLILFLWSSIGMANMCHLWCSCWAFDWHASIVDPDSCSEEKSSCQSWLACLDDEWHYFPYLPVMIILYIIFAKNLRACWLAFLFRQVLMPSSFFVFVMIMILI
jgi:hypothetical protein